MAPKIAVVYYSMYGHIKALADAQVRGIEAAGGKADVYQVAETLPQEVLDKMYAPPKDAAVTAITPEILEGYDGFLLGIPTRYGNFPAQWKTFWDRCGKQWGTGAFQGKFAGLFISTGTLGGGQESTALAAMSTLAHLGIIYVPLGYKPVPQLLELDEVRGGSPWGAGTFTAGDGSRQPSKKELAVAEAQGTYFYQTVSRAENGGVQKGAAVGKTAGDASRTNTNTATTANTTSATTGDVPSAAVAGATAPAAAPKSEIGPDKTGAHGAAGGSQPTAGAAAEKKAVQDQQQAGAAGGKEKKTLCGMPVPDKCVVS